MVEPRNGSIIWLWMLDYDGGVQHSWLSVFRMQTRDYKQLYLVCYESNLKWRRSAHRFPLRSYTSQILVRICLPLGVIFIVWNPVLKSHPHCAFLYQILTWNLREGHVKNWESKTYHFDKVSWSENLLQSYFKMIGPDWTTGNTLGVVGVDEWLSPLQKFSSLYCMARFWFSDVW